MPYSCEFVNGNVIFDVIISEALRFCLPDLSKLPDGIWVVKRTFVMQAYLGNDDIDWQDAHAF